MLVMLIDLISDVISDWVAALFSITNHWSIIAILNGSQMVD